jgi:hypothetical protein
MVSHLICGIQEACPFIPHRDAILAGSIMNSAIANRASQHKFAFSFNFVAAGLST